MEYKDMDKIFEIHVRFFFILCLFLKINFYLKGKSYREESLLVHLPSGCDSWSWACPKPGD